MKQLSIQNQNFKLEDMFIVISLKTWYLFIFIYFFFFFYYSWFYLTSHCYLLAEKGIKKKYPDNFIFH